MPTTVLDTKKLLLFCKWGKPLHRLSLKLEGGHTGTLLNFTVNLTLH